jgi:methionine synthase / methylenetetrahydrofolate reductase(NADPH)
MLLNCGRPILADGAIGEYLFSLGFPGTYLACEAVTRAPQILASVHRDYAGAGAEMLTSDTFDANAIRLDMRGLAERCLEINASAVRIAARNRGVLVAGSVGPLNPSHSFRPALRDADTLRQAYLPQLEGLLEGGVHLLLLETQVDPVQALLIHGLARSLSTDIPIVVSFTFGPDLLTPAGFSVEDCAAAFQETDISALGANHGVGPLQFLEIHRRLSACSRLPIVLKPNSGTGRYVDGSFVFPRNPEHFARCMVSCSGPGTALLGGCCGTTPEFISLLAAKLERGETGSVRVSWNGAVGGDAPAEMAPDNPPRLAAGIAGKSALIVELLPPRGGDISQFAARALGLESLAPVTVSIPDSPMGRVRVSPCLAGLYLREEYGIEPLVHFALRDRSLTRVQSDLLGMAASGIQGVFLISGDPPSLGDYPESTAVYDLSTDEALELVGRLSMGTDMNGRSIGKGAGFFPGSAITLGDPSTPEKVRRRWDLGCRFFITQPVYSMDAVEESAGLLEEYPVVLALMPFRGSASLDYIASEVPGIAVPESLRTAMEPLDDRGVQDYSTGFLGDLALQVRGLVSGIYLAGPLSSARKLGALWRGLR